MPSVLQHGYDKLRKSGWQFTGFSCGGMICCLGEYCAHASRPYDKVSH
jgi:hypothetical protein